MRFAAICALTLLPTSLALPSLSSSGELFNSLFSRWQNRAQEKRATTAVAAGDRPSFWVSEDVYEAESFFEGFDFWAFPDPTHGEVNYVNRESAWNRLAYVTPEGKARIQVDNSTWLGPGQKRDSVRLQSKKSYNGGLFLFDVENSPHGCGVWPAYWANGPNWPNGGEIDIIEGVHDNTHNQVAWHTRQGCTLTSPGNFTGRVLYTNCDANVNYNSGCAIVDPSRSSYGSPFNGRGGGVYAMKWDETGMDVWFFYRATLPQDIRDGAPDPTKWGLPGASLSAQGCPMDEYFKDLNIIINITLCGDWAGSSFTGAGCTGSCNDSIGDPNNWARAFWVINSLRVYRKIYLAGGISSSARVDVGQLSVWSTLLSVIGYLWVF